MPRKLRWHPKYSMQSKEIDAQHRYLFALINELYALQEREHVTAADTLRVLMRLREYAFYHSATEETCFERFGYEGKEEHIRQHDRLRETIGTAMERARRPGEDACLLVADVAAFATEWLQTHILTEDKKCIHIFRMADEMLKNAGAGTAQEKKTA